MHLDFLNKVIVITGSSKGIGSELVRAFAKEQGNVVINYFHSELKAKQLYKEISAYNTNCMLIKADVSNHSDVLKMYHKVVKKYGRVDILINNAGICDDNFLQDMSVEQWQKVIDVNLTGTFLCCREFSRIMSTQHFGKIINIASIKGQKGSMFQMNYAASKAGIISISKSLARELSLYNISVNTVCPGFIVTDLNRTNTHKIEVAQKESLLSINNSLNDLINFMLFLSSDKCLGVSGRVFNIDSRI